MLGVWAVLGSFSVGLLLVPAALLAAFAAGHVVAEARREAWLAGIGALLLVAAGVHSPGHQENLNPPMSAAGAG